MDCALSKNNAPRQVRGGVVESHCLSGHPCSYWTPIDQGVPTMTIPRCSPFSPTLNGRKKSGIAHKQVSNTAAHCPAHRRRLRPCRFMQAIVPQPPCSWRSGNCTPTSLYSCLMNRVLATLVCLAWALWFGGAVMVFVTAGSLFATFAPDKVTAGTAAAGVFRTWERYQLVLAAVALVLTVAWRALLRALYRHRSTRAAQQRRDATGIRPAGGESLRGVGCGPIPSFAAAFSMPTY